MIGENKGIEQETMQCNKVCQYRSHSNPKCNGYHLL